MISNFHEEQQRIWLKAAEERRQTEAMNAQIRARMQQQAAQQKLQHERHMATMSGITGDTGAAYGQHSDAYRTGAYMVNRNPYTGKFYSDEIRENGTPDLGLSKKNKITGGGGYSPNRSSGGAVWMVVLFLIILIVGLVVAAESRTTTSNGKSAQSSSRTYPKENASTKIISRPATIRKPAMQMPKLYSLSHRVNVNGANVRSGPGTHYAVTDFLTFKDCVAVISQTPSGWSKIVWDVKNTQKPQYIKSNLLKSLGRTFCR